MADTDRRDTGEGLVPIPRNGWTDSLRNVVTLIGLFGVVATGAGFIWLLRSDIDHMKLSQAQHRSVSKEIKQDVKANDKAITKLDPVVRALANAVERLNGTLDKLDEKNDAEHKTLWRRIYNTPR